MSDHYIITSIPLKVVWAGWESSTLALQHAGWEFGVSRDHMMNRRIEMVMHHPNIKMSAIMHPIKFEDLYAYASRANGYPDQRHIGPVLRVNQYIAPSLNIQTMGDIGRISAFVPIDMVPKMETISSYDIGELGLFSRRAPEQDILFDKADMTVVEHLESIKRLQSQKQAELRDVARKQRDRDSKVIQFPQQEIVARLVHLTGEG